MDMDQALQMFIAESDELLESMESALLGVLQTSDRSDAVNAIFRAAHTIKGSAGLFAFDGVVAFTHVVESVLDAVRDGHLELDESLVSLLLDCGDHIGGLISAATGGETTADLSERGAGLVGRLKARLAANNDAMPVGVPAAAAVAVATTTPAAASGAVAATECWHLSLRFGIDSLRNGMDPQSFLRYLGKLGSIERIVTLHDALPPLAALDPEACYLGFEFALRSDADKQAIESAFEFVLDDARIRILPPHSPLADYAALIAESDETQLGEILVRCGSLTADELRAAQSAQNGAAQAVAAPQAPAVTVQNVAASVAAEAVSERQKEVKDNKSHEHQSVRVDAQKLDQLINLVGELIIAAASANLLARRDGNAAMQEANAHLTSMVESVRDSALQLRMVKIGGTFTRFRRVVHDVSLEIGKDIALVLKGEDTELDKTVVERIGDPLTHLVRNAMDHGIEATDKRIAAGKPAQGTVTLNAYHDSGSIVIEVSDDGGGIDRDRVLAKAIERGLIEPGRVLTESEIYALVFEPGFSTAEKVSNLSGRGVGMDVVKRNITALRGNVDIHSEVGVGTTVTVRLPLTLAIINGFQVTVDNVVFVIPLEMIDECVAFTAQAHADYVDLRGSVLPFVRLREHFSTGGKPGTRENIVVVRHAGQRFGLVVDNLLGEAQTVIKPLSKMFAQVRGISGSSILGNGEVALILDVPALMHQVGQGAFAGKEFSSQPIPTSSHPAVPLLPGKE